MSAPDHREALAALRQAGADKFDPVHLHYLQALTRRANAHQGAVKHLLDAKLAQALAAYTARFAQSKNDAPCKTTLAPVTPATPLGELARYRAQQTPARVLPSTQYFRNTWSKLSVGKRVTQALDQAPKNAGPINSHMLVLRSLALMRDIAPDYLTRFTNYADTLLSLDQSDGEVSKIPKPRTGPKPRKSNLVKTTQLPPKKGAST